MKLTFMGANRQVTGSRYCLEVNDTRLMIDCGLVQEREFLGRNWESCRIAAGKIKALLLIHIHDEQDANLATLLDLLLGHGHESLVGLFGQFASRLDFYDVPNSGFGDFE